MAPTKMKLRVRKKQGGTSKSPQRPPPRPETSPDSKCPICLDRFVNVASVERCLHRFCFRCIREWAKNKAECPLCKQPFRSIFHSVRTENDFKEFVVAERAAENAASASASTAAAVTEPPAGHGDPDDAEPRARRSRATRPGERGGRAARDPFAPADDGALRRLLPWLRRDHMTDPFLLARTGHILHELVSFARSIEAMQCPPAPSYEEDSGSPSSVINISEDDDGEVGVDVTQDADAAAQDRVPSVPIATSSDISLSQSAWDDETPGPSYSTLSQLQTDGAEPDENQLRENGGAAGEPEGGEDDDECTIVGYVKPMAERTPELVQLSSDSTDEDGGEEGNQVVGMETQDTAIAAKPEPPLPGQTQAPPSPKSYPSTSRVASRTKEQPLSSSDSSVQCDLRSPIVLRVRTAREQRRRPAREQRRRGQNSLGRSFSSSSEEFDQEKSSPAFPPWDSPEPKKPREERKPRRRPRKRMRERQRSRSPHAEPRRHRGDCTLPTRSSSGDDSRTEKPAGKRKYKTRHLESAKRRNGRKSQERKRSPSVEIIFERRASDVESRAQRLRRSRRKKLRRKRAREPYSPAIITIGSSSSSSSDETRRSHNYQRPLMEDDDTDSNSQSVRLKNCETESHVDACRGSFAEFIEYQERGADVTDHDHPGVGGRTVGCQGDIADSKIQRSAIGTGEYPHKVRDCSDRKDFSLELSSDAYTDRTAGGGDRAADAKGHEFSNHAVYKADMALGWAHGGDGDSGVSSQRGTISIGIKPREDAGAEQNGATRGTTSANVDSTNRKPDAGDAAVDFLGRIRDGQGHARPGAGVSMVTAPTHPALDQAVQLNKGATTAALSSPLSQPRMLELEDSLSEEGKEAEPRELRTDVNAVDQRARAGLALHWDQSDAETTSESRDHAET